MRVKSLQLSWFRGAADPVSLEPDCKSMVIYGVNGSGKSSFVDAVEYVLNEGKIKHLAHEYSGRRQEKAIPNTHTPSGQKSEIRFQFKDASEFNVEIMQDGSSRYSGADTQELQKWDYQRTVLRQDEVASFIHDTKGAKYSALLPLLGLHQLEVIAENLRQIAKSIEDQSKLREIKVELNQVKLKRESLFGLVDDEQIFKKIESLHKKHGGDNNLTEDPHSRCVEIKEAVETKIAQSTSDQRKFVALQDAATTDLNRFVDEVRTLNGKLSDEVEPLIQEKLQVLLSASAFVENLDGDEEVNCPACGRSIPVSVFQSHVNDEQSRLHEIIEIYNLRKAAIGTLSDSLRALKSILSKLELKSWRDGFAKESIADNFVYLDSINPEDIRSSCDENSLKEIHSKLSPLIAAAAASAKEAPQDAQQLSTDKQVVEVCRAVFLAVDQSKTVSRVEALILFIESLEQGVRAEIKKQSLKVISEITTDIQSMWAILHPGEAIEDIRLYLPKNADKAIDISLKFYGVDLESPRLTLSEGHRNSLGLCIFLSMAKRESDKDRPLFLDDVVVSLDRNHRGMIVDVLAREFSERQVVIFTHDRDWFTELRQQLDGKNWVFKTLMPYESPELGIRWSSKSTTFDDARALLNERPDSAGNDARKIMDVECGLIAERLKIRLPYMRADKNDKRMAHDFLERFIAGGKKCFQIKTGKDYQPYSDAIRAFELADRLLISWANRASHTFDLVRPEATKLIDACEQARESFLCPECGKNVWFADAAGAESVQCQCGVIRWRYGKG